MYQNHCSNLREVENGINVIERDLRHSISTGNVNNEITHTRILSHLITCWAEVRVHKLIYEDQAFSNSEIAQIIAHGVTLENKWIKALNISYVKAHNLNLLTPIETQLFGEDLRRYSEIKKLINNDLLSSIQVRNRIAHGQWKIAFSSSLKSVSNDLTTRISQENIVSLQLKRNLLDGLARLIHDLAVSPPTFIRDFNRNFNFIEENKRNLHKRSYTNYKLKMVQKYQRGQLKKKGANRLQ